MNRDQKAVAIAEIAEKIEESEAIFAVDYRGITVEQVAELRAKLRQSDATFKVVKNSLTERAADQVGAELLKEYLAGPTALTFVRGDVATAAKTVADYARATQMLPFKGGLMEGSRARRRPDPLALQTSLPRGALRAARRRGRLAHRRTRPQPGRPSRRAGGRSRPGAGEEGVRGDPRGRRRRPSRPREAAGSRGAGRRGAGARGSAAEQAEEQKAEPEQDEPAQDDNKADVSAEVQSEDAETNPTKED